MLLGKRDKNMQYKNCKGYLQRAWTLWDSQSADADDWLTVDVAFYCLVLILCNMALFPEFSFVLLWGQCLSQLLLGEQ